MNPRRSVEFELPFGFVDQEGAVHRRGVMRMPTQKDITIVLKMYKDVDNPAYLETLILVRIIDSLGDLELNATNRQEIIESLAVPDIHYLNRVYEALISGQPTPDEEATDEEAGRGPNGISNDEEASDTTD